MAMTMTQKILAAHAGLDSVKAGQLIMADLDLVLGNDVTSPVAINEFNKAGFSGIFDKNKVTMVMDHFAPKANVALIVCVQSFTASAIGFAVAFVREPFAWSDVMGALPSLLYVAIFCSAVAYTLQGIGQRDADPTVASIVMSLESVFAVISGFLLLHETLSQRELLGCLVMLVAIIIPQLPDKKNKITDAAA
jgi:hypothetical protein